MGFSIFLHAIWLIFSHVGAALRISAFLYLIPMLALLVGAFVLGASGVDVQRTMASWSLVPLLVLAFCSLWVAVAWHRYVLLDEMPGPVLPVFEGSRIFAYLGKSIILGLLTAVIAFAVFIPVGFLVAGFASANPSSIVTQILVLLPVLLAYFVIAVMVYRFSLILPASAVNKPIRLGEAWAATSGGGGTIFQLAFVSAICVVGLEFIGDRLFAANPWIGLVWQLLSGWLQLLVGVSIITTLYGHFVEKRPIA